MTKRTDLSASGAARRGMGLAVVAREHPERLAIASPYGDLNFDLLNARANQLVRALRARGLRSGDSVALTCANRPEFAVAVYATLRAGLRLTPINSHLTVSEMAYIVDNCEARAWLAEGRFAQQVAGAAREAPSASVRLAIGDDSIPGFEAFDNALCDESPDDIRDPELGSRMLYTSGTTGRPKGVFRSSEPPAQRPGAALIASYLRYEAGRDLHLCTGPLYHAAPLAFSLIMPIAAGCGVVMMESWDPGRSLELVEGYGVTHTHMVPIMFNHLLALPEEARRRDLSSLRVVLHGAAPCPVGVKQAMIDWLGPVVYEYYAATEGWGSFVTSEEWLAKPGTVGRPTDGQVEIRDDEGKPQPPGTPGTIYLKAPDEGRFEYYKDPDKTRRSYADDRFTLGDIGYLDVDGDLFLCDRSDDVIISGGVNIYPAEVDAVLVSHPAVIDAATIGAPNVEWGEEVVSVVELTAGAQVSASLRDELLAHCRKRLARFKCPRRIDFSDQLPRQESGKIYRRLLRDHYWEDRKEKI